MALVVIGILAIVALALLLGLRRGQPRRLRRAGGALPEPGGAPDASAIASGEPLQNRTPAVIESEPPAQQAARLDALRLLQGLAFGTPITAPPSSSAHDAIASTVRMSLASIVDKPNYAPRRPLLLPKLVQAMNDDQMSRRELSRIIAGDPALAGSLLRLANSPFYRLTREPIESLDRAVAVLGIEGMRSLIAAALLQPVFRVSGGSFAHFGDITWQHTLFAATGAEAHAAILENSDPFAAQLLSLMMGLSTIIVFRVTLDEFMSRQVAPQAAVMAQLINAQSAIVARHVAASWELSPRIDAALADQIESPLAPRSALGRSLQFGEFIGALAVLRARKVIDDAAAMAALHSGGEHAGAYERIWGRLTAAR
jgi:HD-like signal output (HDOD) protein